MSRDPNFCWIHMKSYCNHCELEQLKKIVRDATKACRDNWSVSEILVILERPIKPSTIEFEDDDGVMHQK